MDISQPVHPKQLFLKDVRLAAKKLIGCVLEINGGGGTIVESEAYSVHGDPAIKRFYTPRRQVFALAHPAGTIHLHTTYGVHTMLNVLTKDQDAIGFILIRALAPEIGVKKMHLRRRNVQKKDLCNGPGKLTQSLNISNDLHGESIIRFLKPRPADFLASIKSTPRIGISQGKDLPWRYLL